LSDDWQQLSHDFLGGAGKSDLLPSLEAAQSNLQISKKRKTFCCVRQEEIVIHRRGFEFGREFESHHSQ
jgi:hypothetical protein